MSNTRVPDTRLLMLDKDCVVDPSWLRRYRELIKLVLDHYGLRATAIRITPSRHKGSHVRIYLATLVSAEKANMLHWLLGDDCARVDFNRARIDAGFDEWSKLFEAPKGR